MLQPGKSLLIGINVMSLTCYIPYRRYSEPFTLAAWWCLACVTYVVIEVGFFVAVIPMFSSRLKTEWVKQSARLRYTMFCKRFQLFCSRLQQSRCHAVIDDLMMTFAASTAAERCILVDRTMPKNCPFQWGFLTPSNLWFLGPMRVIPETASWSVYSFVHSSPLCPAHRPCYVQHL